MFISRQKVELMEQSIRYLDKRIDDEREKRWKLENEFAALTRNLGLRQEEVPKAIKFVKK